MRSRKGYAVCFDKQKNYIVMTTNSGNGEGLFKEPLETLQRNTFTPIEWEGYPPYYKLSPRVPLPKNIAIRRVE